MDLAQGEQRYLLDARAYTATETDLAPGGTPADVAPYYTIAIAAPAANPPTFTITATAKGVQLKDGDLSLDNLGVKTPAGKW
jgi:type IV pilus assembly protein PilE